MPAKLTPRQAAQAKRDLDTKDRLALDTTKKMKALFKDGVEQVYAHYQKTGRYKDPDLSAINTIFIGFYKNLMVEAVASCKKQKAVKKLAALPNPELPDGPAAVKQALGFNSKFFKSLVKRAKVLSAKAMKDYLYRFKKEFQKVIPLFESSSLSPKQAKQAIAKAWGLTNDHTRVETIFRTESTKYFAQAQVAYFEDSDEVIGYMFSSVRDTSRTPICKCREGMVMRKDDKLLANTMPPLHFNCRSALIPLTDDKENRKLFLDPSLNPRNRKAELERYPVMKGFGTK